MKEILFKKSGKEIKASIQQRCQELTERLEKRNQVLEEILNDRNKVRSYMLRQGSNNRHYEYDNPPIILKADIPSEEIEEISQLCKRIYQMEQEINRLKLTQQHLADKATFELTLKELIKYGFKINE